MLQDGGTHANVVVGEPLTAAERGAGIWVDDAGWLDLPSGRLAIHTYDTLPLGDPPGEFEGATVDVPPGRYRVRLHRKDWSAMADAGIDWAARAEDAGLGEDGRSEEHTSELQSPCNLVCRLLLEKKKKQTKEYAG